MRSYSSLPDAKKSFEIPQSYQDATLNIALDTVSSKRQALVFCNTKRGAESQAEKIAQKIKAVHDQNTLDDLSQAVLDAVPSPTKQCQRLAMCIRKGVAFHHSGLSSKQREIIETSFRESKLSIICATPTLAMGMDLPAYRSIIRDLKRYSQGTSWSMSDIPVLEYEQMAGRAGRPGKEKNGEAICIAQTESEKEKIVEKFILGDPEEIYSKLAVEPVLRTYVLSLVSSQIVSDVESLYSFFNDTFYAWQYGDTAKLHSILDKMVSLLKEWEFIESSGEIRKSEKIDSIDGRRSRRDVTYDAAFVSGTEIAASRNGSLRATLLGERVAQLYLDPYTAHHLLSSIASADERGIVLDDLPVLHLLMTAFEMRPLLSVKQSELDAVDSMLLGCEDSLLVKSPSSFSHDYDEFLQTIKTTFAMKAWIDEIGEDALLEEFGMTPGDLQAKRDNIDWLLHSLIELCKLVHWQNKISTLERIRLRVEYGAKDDLLALLRLKGIGRMRARKLVKSGIRTLDDVRSCDGATLKLLLGEKIAMDIKSQVGQKMDPSELRVAPNKRKGQINLGDFDGK